MDREKQLFPSEYNIYERVNIKRSDNDQNCRIIANPEAEAYLKLSWTGERYNPSTHRKMILEYRRIMNGGN